MREKNIRKSASRRSEHPPACLSLAELELEARLWHLDGETAGKSEGYLANRRRVTRLLLWFLRQREYAMCGEMEIREFLGYLRNGYREPGGRWGQAGDLGKRGTAAREPLRPATVRFYYTLLDQFFASLLARGKLSVSPFADLSPPIVRQDQIQPLSLAQVELILAEATRSVVPLRDEAIIRFLFDTGVRASELCGLTIRDLDLSGRSAVVTGKGDKRRAVHFGLRTSRALHELVGRVDADLDAPVFLAARTKYAGEALTRTGLHQLVKRLGERAGITGIRVSPHTFRHSFAVCFLQNGGNVFSLKEMLGHTTLEQTNRYVALAQADLAAQARQFSPGDRLRRR